MPKTNRERRWDNLIVRYRTTSDPHNGLHRMTEAYFDQMAISQTDEKGLRCKCCGSQPIARPYLNYNRDTKIVRGLVCLKCHRILDENINSLEWPDSPRRLTVLGKISNGGRDADYWNMLAAFAMTTQDPLEV